MSEPSFPDHFSGHARTYALHRPSYPESLYERLAHLVPKRERCWDCATGSGQAARHLAPWFDEVMATDASAEQLAHADGPSNVHFVQALAEASTLEDSSIDLVTVAAAIHWFDLEGFYREVRRVARPHAVLAAWSYGPRAVIDHGPIDAVLQRLADDILADDWAPQLDHTRAKYDSLPFPFERIEMPEMDAEVNWTVEALLGKLRSWSGVQAYLARTGSDPVVLIEDELRAQWEQGESARLVRWPLFFRVGYVARPAD